MSWVERVELPWFVLCEQVLAYICLAFWQLVVEWLLSLCYLYHQLLKKTELNSKIEAFEIAKIVTGEIWDCCSDNVRRSETSFEKHLLKSPNSVHCIKWAILYVATFFIRGTYRMERPDGSMFDVRIPPFSLESKEEDSIAK